MEFSREKPDETSGQPQDLGKIVTEGAAAAGAAGRMVREFGSRSFDEQKRRAGAELESVGKAVHRAAEKLRTEEDHRLADVVESTAEQIGGAARYLRDRTPPDMFDDLQSLARRRPELVVSGMFVAGVALARLLKAGGSSASAAQSARPPAQPSRVAAGPLDSPEGDVIPHSPQLPAETAGGPVERIILPEGTEEV